MSSKNPSTKASRQPIASQSAGDGEDDFAALFEATQDKKDSGKARPIAEGDLLSCKVIAIGASSVFVSVGEKAEGTIDIVEFRDPSTGDLTVAVGDEVKATVVDDGGESGSAVLTRMLGRGGHAAAQLEQAYELGVPVEGVVSGETKGGFEVQIGSIRAFCPGSQIDLRRGGERTPSSSYIGQRFSFRVTKVENDARNVVVSRRDILEEQAAEEATQTWKTIREGAIVEGVVRTIRDFGAFVDLGGVDGMIHISELAFTRVSHPSDVLEVGQTVRVQIIKVADKADKDGRRQIGLSLRALAEDPWSTVATRFPAGTTFSGEVKRVEAYGAFVELEPGIEGLVHISKMALDRRLNHARQAASVGDIVEVTVVGVDAGERRISLSMVEADRQSREAEESADRREQQRVMADQSEASTLGTFADLLAEAQKK